MLDAILDALLDSLKIFGIAFVINFILSFVEKTLTKKMNKNNIFSPLIASSISLIPQCGTSIVASDLYLKRHITVGTLIAAFVACSDEAVPILLSNGRGLKAILPLLIIKFILGFVIGFLIDLIIYKGHKNVHEHLEHCHHEEEVHVGCCDHQIDGEESKLEHHLWHPIKHSVRVFLFVLGINLIFSLLIYWIGEESIYQFLNANKYITPLLSSLVGLIPNCASSVLITDMYVLESLSFGALLGGLIVNSGLGLIYLYKDKTKLKEAITITVLMFIIGVGAGYLSCFIWGF